MNFRERGMGFRLGSIKLGFLECVLKFEVLFVVFVVFFGFI